MLIMVILEKEKGEKKKEKSFGRFIFGFVLFVLFS